MRINHSDLVRRLIYEMELRNYSENSKREFESVSIKWHQHNSRSADQHINTIAHQFCPFSPSQANIPPEHTPVSAGERGGKNDKAAMGNVT